MSAALQTEIDRRPLAFNLLETHPERFRSDFHTWLARNFQIYLAFEHEADRIWNVGRRNYSQRTIWEYMRHETAVREKDSEFKLNDHYVKDVALLYVLLHPDRDEFFEFRYTLSAVRRAA